MKENESGQKNFLQMRKDLADHPIEKVGEKLRALCHGFPKIRL
jgi:ketol-acid reductoisomerase